MKQFGMPPACLSSSREEFTASVTGGREKFLFVRVAFGVTGMHFQFLSSPSTQSILSIWEAACSLSIHAVLWMDYH